MFLCFARRLISVRTLLKVSPHTVRRTPHKNIIKAGMIFDNPIRMAIITNS